MKYDIILADIDNTLFDFSASSYAGLCDTFSHFGFPFGEAERDVFFAINDQMWRDFEVGKIEKSEIYEGRFARYFAAQNLSADAHAMNAYYMVRLREGRFYMPHCRELLEALAARGCEVYGATNGETLTQMVRMDNSGMRGYFKKIFISEEMGCNKPSKEFFDAIFREIGEDKRARAIMLGDSLTSDMQGGRNGGIATCFFGDPAAADDRCDYVIERLPDFLSVIESGLSTVRTKR